MQKVSVIIAAAGSASRMQGVDKQLIPLGGIPVIMHSVLLFDRIEDVLDIVIVTREDYISGMKKLCKEYTVNKPVTVVAGGQTRQDSCIAGLLACDSRAAYAAFHDGARPLADEKDVRQVIADAMLYQAATLGVPSKDTVKIIDTEGFIQETPPRELVYSIQTPQVFEKTLYLTGVEKAVAEGKTFTDDCQLIESLGKKVFVTKGSYQNIKITTPEDQAIAEVLEEKRKDVNL